jgi:hypothetical protein
MFVSYSGDISRAGISVRHSSPSVKNSSFFMGEVVWIIL